MLSINAAISAVVVLASRLHDDLAVFALMLFSVEAFALVPIFRRRIQVSLVITSVILCANSIWNAVDAGSCSNPCYATIRIGGSGRTITYIWRGRVDERDIWRTRCFDVGTAVQIVSLSSYYSVSHRGLLTIIFLARSADLGMQQLHGDVIELRAAEPSCVVVLAV